MAAIRTVHRCTECGSSTPRWVGRCPACGAWNTLVEEVKARPPRPGRPVPAGDLPVPLADVVPEGWAARPTGIGELDRVLGGGLVPGSVTLVGGEPGIGKSTLLLQGLASVARSGRPALYVSAEESKQQVRLRAERLDATPEALWIVAGTSLPAVVTAIEQVAPEVVVVDSIQSIFDPELGSAPGTVVQVRECAHQLVQEAKVKGIAILLVGHVTKEGTLAGPRVLEHVVDTVLSFEGDRQHPLRLLGALKHRFASTGELGLFEMGDAGLRGVPDASGYLLEDRRRGVAGSSVLPAVEGQRPMLVELQSLVCQSPLAVPRLSAQGVDHGRLAMLLAVLAQRADVVIGKRDVYVSAVGGVRVWEPAADLAVALAVASAAMNVPLPNDLVVFGEVGLAGELRRVGQAEKRLTEAARLGFTRAVAPAALGAVPPGIHVDVASTLLEALDAAFGSPAGAANGRSRPSAIGARPPAAEPAYE